TREAGGVVYAGLPRALHATSEYQLLENSSFWTGYSEYRQNPLWSSYRLGLEEKGIPAGRISYFKSDSRVRNPVSHSDFAKTGFDRGHLAPNSGIATRYGEVGQLETFVMSNVCPQAPDLNRKLWETIERLEDDKWANSLGEVYVIAGPIFDETRQFLPAKKRGDIEIPDAFFKVIVDETSTDARMLAFLIPQTVTGKERPDQFLVSVDEIERRAGLDLFPALSDERENRLEAHAATELFPVN
ncbi:MAG TPA: DNA/RNA non-specific endonuclease, partial [Candidatus Ozemobacteraceae bacterium]|nr:DNA/RNA non-specific endonuclease [Candidatus Ozemobacteraceae bacterium]